MQTVTGMPPHALRPGGAGKDRDNGNFLCKTDKNGRGFSATWYIDKK